MPPGGEPGPASGAPAVLAAADLLGEAEATELNVLLAVLGTG
ncbi:hypothetical protein ACWDOR_40850 [Streptosporangium canum]